MTITSIDDYIAAQSGPVQDRLFPPLPLPANRAIVVRHFEFLVNRQSAFFGRGAEYPATYDHRDGAKPRLQKYFSV